MKRFLLVLALLAVSTMALAGELVVTGPAFPLPPGGTGIIRVAGLSDDDVRQASVEIVPSEGVTAYPAKLWSGDHIIIFSSIKPGKYQVSVKLNGWRTGLESGVAAITKEVANAEKAGLDPTLSAELKRSLQEINDTNSKIALRYPFGAGTCSVEVAGTLPPPVDPEDPNPPDPPNPSKVTKVTYVYEKDFNNVPRPVQLALQQLNAGSSGIVASVHEEDTLDGTGQVPDQYKIALAAAQKNGLPALVVQAGDVVVRTVSAPTTLEQVLEAAK